MADSLTAWLDTGSWANSEDFLRDHPEMLNESTRLELEARIGRAESAQARAMTEDHRTLLAWCREDGVARGYERWRRLLKEEAELIRLAAEPGMAVSARRRLVELAEQLGPTRKAAARMDLAGALLYEDENLSGALTAAESVVATRVLLLPSWCRTIADIVAAATHQPEPSTLERVIAVGTTAISTLPADSMSILVLLGPLAGALRIRHHFSGERADLDAAVTALDRVMTMARPIVAQWISLLENLASALVERYQSHGTAESDLDRSVATYEEAVATAGPESPRRPGMLANLAGALMMRHEVRPELGDLGRAIDLVGSVDLIPGDPFEAMVAGCLCALAWTRFERDGNPADLDLAAAAGRRAVAASRPDAIDLPSHLIMLAHVEQALGQADAAVEYYRRALDLTTPSAVQRRSRLTSLGTGLVDRFRRRGSERDLNEALACFQQAVTGNVVSFNDIHAVLNLAAGRELRYEVTGTLADLDAAASALRSIVPVLPLGSIIRPKVLNNLATVLGFRHRHGRDPADLFAATEHLREAYRIVPAQAPGRLILATNLATALNLEAGLRHRPGLRDEAVTVLRAELSAATGSGDLARVGAMVALARVLATRGDRAEAEAVLRDALSTVPAGAPEADSVQVDLAICVAGRGADPAEVRDLLAGPSTTADPVTALRASAAWAAWAEARDAVEDAAEVYFAGSVGTPADRAYPSESRGPRDMVGGGCRGRWRGRVSPSGGRPRPRRRGGAGERAGRAARGHATESVRPQPVGAGRTRGPGREVPDNPCRPVGRRRPVSEPIRRRGHN